MLMSKVTLTLVIVVSSISLVTLVTSSAGASATLHEKTHSSFSSSSSLTSKTVAALNSSNLSHPSPISSVNSSNRQEDTRLPTATKMPSRQGTKEDFQNGFLEDNRKDSQGLNKSSHLDGAKRDSAALAPSLSLAQKQHQQQQQLYQQQQQKLHQSGKAVDKRIQSVNTSRPQNDLGPPGTVGWTARNKSGPGKKNGKEDRRRSRFWQEDIQVGCRELRARRYITDGFCTSEKPIKEVVCAGNCLPIMDMPWYAEFVKTLARTKLRDWQCVEDIVRKKRVKLLCQNGDIRTYRIKVVKSCKCKKITNLHNRTSYRTKKKKRRRRRKRKLARKNKSGRGS